MPRVSKEQAKINRQRVVEVAAGLFRERGLHGVGVVDIMAAAGMTHGGFYGQFANKDALAAEAGGTLGVILGSGFEDDPGLITEIGRRYRLIGTSGEAVGVLKDPFALADLCGRLGLPHPAVSAGPVADPSRWLMKAVGGSGGGHIRQATADVP